MDSERRVNMSEGVPLNSECATNIILNTGKHTKLSSPNGTVIHLKSERSATQEVGVHINTTLCIAASRKVKLLFFLNFLLSIVAIAVGCSLAFYYWHELSLVRRQLDLVKEQLVAHSVRSATAPAGASALVYAPPRPVEQEGAAWSSRSQERAGAGQRYFVEGLKEDLHFTNSRSKLLDSNAPPLLSAASASSAPSAPDLVVAHFVGGGLELNLRKESAIGPWAPDYQASSRGFERRLELTESKFVSVHEDGLYFIYAQVVYQTNAPNCFYIWAQQGGEKPRLLTTCASGDVALKRAPRQAQISCATQTVARLRAGDRLNFAQREKNSTVLLQPGSSHFGFVRLAS